MTAALLIQQPQRELDGLCAESLAVLDGAVKEYQPAHVFALLSGGHDSLTTTHLVSRHPSFSGVIHINTGIGVPETNEFVRETCRDHGWTLHELTPSEAVASYLSLVVRYGFPGPAQHTVMYRYLKERPLETFLGTLDKRRGDKIMLCAGARSEESVRRMGTVQTTRVRKNQVWVNPIHNWTSFDTTRYITRHTLRRNPVKDKLHLSGECLCGCFADKNERREIALWFPHVEKRLAGLESVVRAVYAARKDVGSPIEEEQTRWGWGRGMPEGLVELFPMCHYCHAGREEAQGEMAV